MCVCVYVCVCVCVCVYKINFEPFEVSVVSSVKQRIVPSLETFKIIKELQVCTPLFHNSGSGGPDVCVFMGLSHIIAYILTREDG